MRRWSCINATHNELLGMHGWSRAMTSVAAVAYYVPLLSWLWRQWRLWFFSCNTHMPSVQNVRVILQQGDA